MRSEDRDGMYCVRSCKYTGHRPLIWLLCSPAVKVKGIVARYIVHKVFKIQYTSYSGKAQVTHHTGDRQVGHTINNMVRVSTVIAGSKAEL